MTQSCMHYGKYGHWYGDHNKYDSPNSSHPSSDTTIQSPSAVPTPPVQKDQNMQTQDPPEDLKAVKFNMACISSSSQTKSDIPLPIAGYMADNGTPYSAIWFSEICNHSCNILPNWHSDIRRVPQEFSDCTFWQYGIGNHSSKMRLIIGYFVLPAGSSDGTIMHISHIVLEGYSNGSLDAMSQFAATSFSSTEIL